MKEISLDKIKQKLQLQTYKLDYEKILNPQQLEAVCAKEGKILLVAGAGTGKTNTIVHRVARLIEDGEAPESILLLTFTKKAAIEMTQRANTILDDRCSKIYTGTYHSFAANMLRRYGSHIGLANNFTILDQSDAADVVNLVRTELGLDKKERKFPKKSVLLDIFSASVNKFKSIEDIVYQYYPSLIDDIPDILLCFNKYKEFKQEKQTLDYDDLLIKLCELLDSGDVIRDTISGRFKYIMVDEYQDSNIIQSNILQKLCVVHGNLMVIGDANQSIFGFRGAYVKNIMNFPEQFESEEVKIIKLYKNYRSTQHILNLSNEVMKQVNNKYYNPLETDDKSGEKPNLVYLPTGYTQSLFVTQQILEAYEQGNKLKDICVLTRNAYLTAELQVMLTSANIKFKVVGGRKFLDSAHIKDIIAFIKVLENPMDIVAWLRILELHEGVGPSTAKKIINTIDITSEFKIQDTKEGKAIKKRKFYGNIEKLLENLNKARNDVFYNQFEVIANYYTPLLNENYDDAVNRANDIEMFSSIAQKYKTAEEFLTDITLDPSEISINEDSDDEDDYLTISTIHSAKGLEWKVTFLLFVNDGILPSAKSMDDMEEMQEELRLLYVAITRAKKSLTICIPAEIFSFGTPQRMQISRFLSNVKNLNKVVEKCKVR